MSVYWRSLKPYMGLIVLTLISLLVARAAATIEPLYLKKIIDYIVSNPSTQLVGNSALVSLIIVFFSLRIVSFVFEFLRDFFFAPAQIGAGRDISKKLFDKLLGLSIRYHHDQKTGSLARRIARGAQSINFILDIIVLSVLPTLAELMFVTILLLRLYPLEYTLVTVSTVVLYALFTVYTTELRQKYRLAANVADDESSAIQIETIYNMETVKYFGNEEFQRKKFLDKVSDWYQSSVRSNQLFAAVNAGQAAILLVGFGLIIYFAIGQALSGRLTVGDLVLLTTYIVRLATPISMLGFVYRRIKDGVTDLEEISKIFSEPLDLQPDTGTKKLSRFSGSIKFEDVYFGYKNRPALRGLSFEVPAGSRVAIVGPSGAGKSTIVKLLFRLYDLEKGKIKFDDINITDIDARALYSLIALVPQETTLFNDTIEYNIRFGKPDATSDEIKRAVRLANLDKLISRLPDGLATVVGERGVKLSGGEKQRVSVARAILKDPKVLVFDEATSNLDAESEAEIIKSIREVSSGRTTISIAHRLPTIIDNDVIFVLDNGSLAEKGTHQELLSKKGVYWRLWQNFEKEENNVVQIM